MARSWTNDKFIGATSYPKFRAWAVRFIVNWCSMGIIYIKALLCGKIFRVFWKTLLYHPTVKILYLNFSNVKLTKFAICILQVLDFWKLLNDNRKKTFAKLFKSVYSMVLSGTVISLYFLVFIMLLFQSII